MPYLTCIGPHGSNRKNKSGYGSRGYWVFRRGSRVVTRWGPVRARRARTYELEWASGQQKIIPCGTISKAKQELDRIVQSLMRPTTGYALLRRGVHIRRWRFSAVRW